jgi:hypothetical protein
LAPRDASRLTTVVHFTAWLYNLSDLTATNGSCKIKCLYNTVKFSFKI